ncbi:hypothetical protein R1flu_016320 [Riccia fluitans]|uniref:Uncharacterized protein n=1 Tax=Riccia fluitans TaxID=41844 RepID=A0ABD1YMJ5_9MARC
MQHNVGDHLWNPEAQRFTTFADPARLNLRGLESPVLFGISGPAEAILPTNVHPAGVHGSMHTYPLRIVGSPEAGVQSAIPTSAENLFAHTVPHQGPPSSQQQRTYTGTGNGNTSGGKNITFGNPITRNSSEGPLEQDAKRAWQSPNPRILQGRGKQPPGRPGILDKGMFCTGNIFKALNSVPANLDMDGWPSTSRKDQQIFLAQERGKTVKSDSEETSSCEMSEDSCSDSEEENTGEREPNNKTELGTGPSVPTENRENADGDSEVDVSMEESEGDIPANNSDAVEKSTHVNATSSPKLRNVDLKTSQAIEGSPFIMPTPRLGYFLMEKRMMACFRLELVCRKTAVVE